MSTAWPRLQHPAVHVSLTFALGHDAALFTPYDTDIARSPAPSTTTAILLCRSLAHHLARAAAKNQAHAATRATASTGTRSRLSALPLRPDISSVFLVCLLRALQTRTAKASLIMQRAWSGSLMRRIALFSGGGGSRKAQSRAQTIQARSRGRKHARAAAEAGAALAEGREAAPALIPSGATWKPSVASEAPSLPEPPAEEGDDAELDEEEEPLMNIEHLQLTLQETWFLVCNSTVSPSLTHTRW